MAKNRTSTRDSFLYDDLEQEYEVRPHSATKKELPDPCIVIKIDGTYDAWSMREQLRANGPTREEAMRRLHSLQTGAYE